MAFPPIAPGGPERALRQQVPKTLAVGDPFDRLQHGCTVPEAQFQSAGLFQTDQAVLETFHGEGDGGRSGNGVHDVEVAEFIGLGNHLQIVHTAVGAEPGGGFVLRSADRRVEVVCPAAADLGFAADCTGETGAAPFQQFLLVGFPIDLICTFKYAALEITGRQHPGSQEPIHKGIGAFLMQIPTLGVVSDFPCQMLSQSRQFLGCMGQITIIDRPAAHCHSLEIFGAHHRSDAVAPVVMAHRMRQRGIQDAFFSGQSDLEHLDFMIPQFGPDLILDFTRGMTPQMPGIF